MYATHHQKRRGRICSQRLVLVDPYQQLKIPSSQRINLPSVRPLRFHSRTTVVFFCTYGVAVYCACGIAILRASFVSCRSVVGGINPVHAEFQIYFAIDGSGLGSMTPPGSPRNPAGAPLTPRANVKDGSKTPTTPLLAAAGKRGSSSCQRLGSFTGCARTPTHTPKTREAFGDRFR